MPRGRPGRLGADGTLVVLLVVTLIAAAALSTTAFCVFLPHPACIQNKAFTIHIETKAFTIHIQTKAFTIHIETKAYTIYRPIKTIFDTFAGGGSVIEGGGSIIWGGLGGAMRRVIANVSVSVGRGCEERGEYCG